VLTRSDYLSAARYSPGAFASIASACTPFFSSFSKMKLTTRWRSMRDLPSMAEAMTQKFAEKGDVRPSARKTSNNLRSRLRFSGVRATPEFGRTKSWPVYPNAAFRLSKSRS